MHPRCPILGWQNGCQDGTSGFFWNLLLLKRRYGGAEKLVTLACYHKKNAAHPPDVDQIWHPSVFPAVLLTPPNIHQLYRAALKKRSNHFWMSGENFNLHNQSDFWEKSHN